MSTNEYDNMTLAELKARAGQLAAELAQTAARAAGGDTFSDAEIRDIEASQEKAQRMARAKAVMNSIKGTARHQPDPGTYEASEMYAAIDESDDPAFAPAAKGALASTHWAKSVQRNLTTAARANGVKALLTGQVQTPSVVEVSALPIKPRRLLDLIPRVGMDGNTYGFLRQTVATNNADVVPDNALKPTSIYTLTEVEGRARVIAHLSEPFPLRYLEDYEQLGQVLDTQMVAGVLEKLEAEILAGDGTGEHFTGILGTSGITQVAFKTDALTTVRSALTAMLAKGESPTAWVLNPQDVEELELLRENGATGGFLMNSAAYDTIFGAQSDITRVLSNSVPKGTALLADWGQTRLRIRQGAHTLAATQAGDLFDKNQVKLRAEGRFAFDIYRPQAVAVVDLSAA